jgi:antitoxin component YwqK of YwqJK toxin-antitoxin module
MGLGAAAQDPPSPVAGPEMAPPSSEAQPSAEAKPQQSPQTPPVYPETAPTTPSTTTEPSPVTALPPQNASQAPAVQLAPTAIQPVTPSEAADAKAETITERYPNGSTKIQRQIVQDAAGNYVNQGAYTMYDLDGKVLRTGEFRSGKLHGKWVQTFNKDEQHLFTAGHEPGFLGPYLSEATFSEGKLHGTWTIKDRNGQNIVEWNFANGVRSGKWTWWYPSGEKRREATYSNGALNGDVIELERDGKQISQRTYVEDKYLDKVVGWHTPGQKHFEGFYLRAQTTPEPIYDWWKNTVTEGAKPPTGQDQKHGTWVSWYRNGTKQAEGQYDHGVMVGKFTWWYENGQKQAEGEYAAGQQTGVWTAWHTNGLKESQGEYHNGAAIGKWSRWDTEGKLQQVVDHSKPRTTPTSVRNNRTTARPMPVQGNPSR